MATQDFARYPVDLEYSLRNNIDYNLIEVIEEKLKKNSSSGAGEGTGGDGGVSKAFLEEVWRAICLHDSVRCATLLLGGGSGIIMDPCSTRFDCRMYPLQLAAQTLSRRVVKVLLQYGAQPNLDSDCDGVDPLELPLSLALRALCDNKYLREWTPEKSIFKLFYILVLHPLREPLNIVKLLALRTDQVEKICLHYVLEGELVQLAALLMTAWHKLVTPYVKHGVEDSPVAQYILEELRAASKKLKSYTCEQELVLIRDRTTKLESAWKIFKLLGMARDTLETYRTHHSDKPRFRVVMDVTSLLSEHGIEMQDEDKCVEDLKCLMPKTRRKMKVWLNQDLEKKLNGGLPLFTTLEKCSMGAPFHSRAFHSCQSLSFIAKRSESKPFKSNKVVTLSSIKKLTFMVPAVARKIVK